MNDLLKELLGRMVEVRSQSGNGEGYDQGELVGYDDRWIKLDKGSEEVLYFPIANIRLLKPKH